ncbi:unnamed protein product [Lampetra planeri]
MNESIVHRQITRSRSARTAASPSAQSTGVSHQHTSERAPPSAAGHHQGHRAPPEVTGNHRGPPGTTKRYERPILFKHNIVPTPLI